ncbi:MAG: hypothetical protein HYZ75_10045 [Elusimicrobia bacterium]|nr:hypothetical protein [Elusimicrobiota bacterium]
MLVFVSKDTVVLKKLHHAKLSELSHRTKGRAMPMHGIVNEIRRYRQERKSLS